MLERSKKMTRSEHREASHLEDDGGIRQIIQSAQVMPISELEKSGGQFAALEKPQQLWGRKGWSQFTGFTKDSINIVNSKKRKLDSETTANDTPMCEDNQPPRKKVTTRTLAFIDCRNPNPKDRESFEHVESEDSDDEPILSRALRISSTMASNTPTHHSLKIRSEDPYMGYPFKGDNHQGGGVQPPGSVDSSQDRDSSHHNYHRVSISQMLNDTPQVQFAVEERQLTVLDEILRRL